jgi:hypothetical protein
MISLKLYTITVYLEQGVQQKTASASYAHIFAFFFQPIAVAPETTDKLITCACILHNILREAKVLAPRQSCFG